MGKKRITSKQMRVSKASRMKIIAERVIHVREHLELTQKDVAVLLGVTSVSVYQAERHFTSLLFEIIIVFANNYQINPAWIIVEDNRQIPQVVERVKGITKRVTAIQEEQMDADQLATRIRRDVLRLKELVEKETTIKQKKPTKK